MFLTLRNQNESWEKEKIEARFFELIKLHRENVQELLFRNGSNNLPISEGRKVFKDVYEQITEAISIADVIFKFKNPKESLKPVDILDDTDPTKMCLKNELI